ncbi:hypothetical protein [Micromonospora sp. NBC_01638]|nr:hypothetical protein OG811_23280 [Micromonospora sp. NBC_01638]
MASLAESLCGDFAASSTKGKGIISRPGPPPTTNLAAVTLGL